VNVSVLGLGLIGGSLLRALAAQGHPVTGYDLDPATRDLATRSLAESSSAEQRVAGSVAEAVEGAELVVLAVPLPAVASVAEELRGFAGLITDVTSVKSAVRERLAGRRFVGGHPMAGKETSSFAASDPRLFEGCAWVLCLEEETELGDWLALARLYTALGARVVPTTATEHDAAVARISHVPHLLASALSAQLEGNPLAGTLAAGSFRDGSRVAATRPALTAAMCSGNAAATREILDAVLAELQAYRDALDDLETLTARVSRPSALRRAWADRSYASVTVPPTRDALLSLGRDGGWIAGAGHPEAGLGGFRPETDRIGS
jgi:prephenate dehydrogenase